MSRGRVNHLEVAFIGQVVGIHIDKVRGGLRCDFRMSHLWKGPISDTATVYTARNTAACGYPFKMGSYYLVFCGPSQGGPPTTSLCSGNVCLDDSWDQIWLERCFLGDPLYVYENGTLPPVTHESVLEDILSPRLFDWQSSYKCSRALEVGLLGDDERTMSLLLAVIRGGRTGSAAAAARLVAQMDLTWKSAESDLVQAMQIGTPDLRAGCLSTFSRFWDPESLLPYSLPALTDEADIVRTEAALAMCRAGHEGVGAQTRRVVSALTHALGDSSADVRIACVFALGAFGREAWRARQALRQLERTDPDDMVRKAAERSLQEIR